MSTAPTTRVHTGSCLCGAVRYRIDGPLRPIFYCHCSQCRKTSGNFVAASACNNEHLTLLSEASLRWFDSSPQAQRGFCKLCGSNLFWRPVGGERTSIMAGSLDTPSGVKAIAHIFVSSAPDYLTISDGLPQYDNGGPDELGVIPQ